MRKIAKNGKLNQSEIDYFNYLVEEVLKVKALPDDLREYLKRLFLPDLDEILSEIHEKPTKIAW